MRTRTPMLFLVLTALMLGSVGSVAAVGSTSGTADACSIAAPWVEVNPTQNLQPGQQVQIVGYGYSDLIWHETPPAPAPDEPPLALCDFDMTPMQDIKIVWHGDTIEVLAVVSGPDFKVSVTVPTSASPGKAWIGVGTDEVWVSVLDGETIPPDPCPLMLQPDGTAQHRCPEPPPEPWPCPHYLVDENLANENLANGAVGTQPAPGVDVAPGYLPACPEPCVDYLHTTTEGTTYDYKWDCPDPCGYPQAAPGSPADSSAVWCPPPDPCYWVGGDARVCPDPCPASGHAGDEPLFPCPDPCLSLPNAPDGIETNCPDPCAWVGGDARACPEPCPLAYASDARAKESATQDIWPCPPPCGSYLDAEAANFAPCPDPCYWVGGDARVCPDPCPVYVTGAPDRLAPDDVDNTMPIYCPDPCGPDAHTSGVWCPPPFGTATTASPPVTPPADEPEDSVEVASVTLTEAPRPVAEASSAVPAFVVEPAAPASLTDDAPAEPVLAQPTVAQPADVEPKAVEQVSLEPLANEVSMRVMRSASAIFAALFGS